MVKIDQQEIDREQAERQEYVKNIGIEYRFGCYEEKRADSCQLLAEYMEAIQQNFKGALTLFRQNCEERKYPKSCYKYAMYLLAGKECEPSLEKMLRPLEIACEANINKGCRACDLEDGEACWLLSTWYMGSKEKFINAARGKDDKYRDATTTLGVLDRDMAKSLEYGIKACNQGIPHSCANVSRMYKLGDGVEQSDEKAKSFADKATELIKAMQDRDNSAGFTA